MNHASQARTSSGSLLQHLRSAISVTIVSILLLGGIYPAVVTAIAQVAFKAEANGSLITNAQGTVVGSQLSGQVFSKPQYFHGRPSAAGSGYDPLSSSGTNLGPTSKKLLTATRAAIAQTMHENATSVAPPSDLVSSSASGLDPDITPQAAAYQIGRVARARGLPRHVVEMLVAQNTGGRDLGILGEYRVHVLSLNIALDARNQK